MRHPRRSPTGGWFQDKMTWISCRTWEDPVRIRLRRHKTQWRQTLDLDLANRHDTVPGRVRRDLLEHGATWVMLGSEAAFVTGLGGTRL